MTADRLAPAADPGASPGPVARIGASVHGWLSFEIDPFVLGLFRAALGAYVLAFYLMLIPSWTFYYGPDGIGPLEPLDLHSYQLLSPLILYVRSDAVLWALHLVSVVSAILLALGVRWRLAALWLWHMNLALVFGNPFAANGEEQVLCILLLFSLFLPLGASFTWHQLRHRERRRAMFLLDARVPVWTLRPLQIHLLLVYLLSLPAKLADPAWRDGTLVYYAMMAVDYPRWPGVDVFGWANAALSRVLTAIALAVEIVVPFLIWSRRLRLPCLLSAIGLHLGMALLIEGVMMFNLAMVVGMLLFLPSRRMRLAVGRRLGIIPTTP